MRNFRGNPVYCTEFSSTRACITFCVDTKTTFAVTELNVTHFNQKMVKVMEYEERSRRIMFYPCLNLLISIFVFPVTVSVTLKAFDVLLFVRHVDLLKYVCNVINHFF